jgi:nitrite reductase/ring-hydroxylating ferredoxin subunit
MTTNAPRAQPDSGGPVSRGTEAELPVCGDQEVTAGEILHRRLAGGLNVALTRLADGSIVCFDALCPHSQGPLWAGKLSGEDVICPWHGFRFELRTGAVSGLESILKLRRWPVSVRDGKVFIAG